MNRGCSRELATGQWWTYCGETDMGQTLPVLCTQCGGEYKLAPTSWTVDDHERERQWKAKQPTRQPTDTPIVGEAIDLLDEGFKRAEKIWEQKPATPDEATIFEFLTRKYVQRADARQADLGLQYMEAETHDLARELAKWLKG